MQASIGNLPVRVSVLLIWSLSAAAATTERVSRVLGIVTAIRMAPSRLGRETQHLQEFDRAIVCFSSHISLVIF